MKKLCILIITVICISACEKKEDPNLTPLEQLPAKTQIGANTAGCLVDGEALTPKGFFTTGNLVCQYINQKDFVLGISKKEGSTSKSIYIYVYETNLKVDAIYKLEESIAYNSKYGEYRFPFSHIYQTNSNVVGELKITHHNYNNATISGTFWFDAIDKDGNSVKIREGRFDCEY